MHGMKRLYWGVLGGWACLAAELASGCGRTTTSSPSSSSPSPSPTPPASSQPKADGAANAELRAIYAEDQADRTPSTAIARGEDAGTILERDARRRKRVTEILDGGGATSSTDFFHAAMVFQHGDTPADIVRAYALALRAAEIVPTHPKARWLAAASKDRELMYLGKPQLYGTQFRVEDGHWVLYQVDSSVTDEERAKWGVPALAEARKQVAYFEKIMPAQPEPPGTRDAGTRR